MRVIHSRKFIYNDKWKKDKNMLLVWALAAILWKYYNYDVILYIDNHTLDIIKEFHIDELYDEINTEYFEDKTTFENIDLFNFWALPKLKSLYHEIIELGNDAVACDTDVVPIKDLHKMWNNAEVVVWSNNEFKEMKLIYPNKKDLSIPEGYEYPEWVKFNAQPLNTGVIHFRRKKIAEEFLTESFRFCVNNKNELHNSNTQTMCSAEQLFIGNYLMNNNISYTCIQPLGESVFNKNAFHTHSYKILLKDIVDLRTKWAIDLLLIIKKFNEDYFNKIIDLPLFKREKLYFDHIGYRWVPVQELDKYIEALSLC